MKCVYKDCSKIVSYEGFKDHLKKCESKNLNLCSKGCGFSGVSKELIGYFNFLFFISSLTNMTV